MDNPIELERNLAQQRAAAAAREQTAALHDAERAAWEEVQQADINLLAARVHVEECEVIRAAAERQLGRVREELQRYAAE